MVRITVEPANENFSIQLVLLESLKASGWQGSWDIDGGSIHIESNIGVSLEEYITEDPLDYSSGLRLALCLGSQLSELSKNEDQLGDKYGILFFNVKDILVINKDWYLLTNLSNVLPLSDDNQVVLQHPIDFDGLLAPELIGADTLPLAVHHTCAYYSLALLCLRATDLDNKNNGGIDSLNGSKFYYLLQRCLESDPKNRRFIYV